MRCPFAEWIPSPTFTPGRVSVVMRVEHTTVTTMEGAIATLCNPARQASAHFIVGMDGRIVQLVDTDDTAWHAGNWPWNQKSIGIEHVDNTTPQNPTGYNDSVRTPELYAASAKLNRWIGEQYGLTPTADSMQRHKVFTATACPDALDVERIIIETAGGDMADYIERAEFERLKADLDGTFGAMKARLAIDAHHLGHSPEHKGEPIETRLVRGLRAADIKIDTSYLKPRKLARKARRPTAAQVRAGHGRG